LYGHFSNPDFNYFCDCLLMPNEKLDALQIEEGNTIRFKSNLETVEDTIGPMTAEVCLIPVMVERLPPENPVLKFPSLKR